MDRIAFLVVALLASSPAWACGGACPDPGSALAMGAGGLGIALLGGFLLSMIDGRPASR